MTQVHQRQSKEDAMTITTTNLTNSQRQNVLNQIENVVGSANYRSLVNQFGEDYLLHVYIQGEDNRSQPVRRRRSTVSHGKSWGKAWQVLSTLLFTDTWIILNLIEMFPNKWL